jgi:hypothetical protein
MNDGLKKGALIILDMQNDYFAGVWEFFSVEYVFKARSYSSSSPRGRR